jgi:hypothetical protein
VKPQGQFHFKSPNEREKQCFDSKEENLGKILEHNVDDEYDQRTHSTIEKKTDTRLRSPNECQHIRPDSWNRRDNVQNILPTLRSRKKKRVG